MTIKSKLIISSTLFIIVATVLMWTGFSVNKEKQGDLIFINYAGQLRFRSYRLAWLIHEYRRHIMQRAEYASKIKKDMDEFEDIILALAGRGNKYDIKEVKDKEIMPRLNKHRGDWHEIKPMIEGIIKTPDEYLIEKYEEQMEKYVDEVNATIKLFEYREGKKSRDFIVKIYLVAILSLCLFLIYLFYVYRQTVIPLGTLIKGMNDFSKGNFHTRLNIKSNDEVGNAASTFNSMAEKIENMYARLASTVDQLCDANYKLEKVARLRSMALPILSHELKTPLTSIKGFVHTLLREDARLSETVQKKYLSTINSEAERLSRLLDELLDMTKLEIGKLGLNLKPASISEIIRDVSGRVNISNIELELQNGIPQILLDKNKIEQVISNLIDNAIKYSPNGEKIKIEIKDEGEFIKVTVDDEGVGIPKSERENVFDAFYRASSDLIQHTKGIGLGLFICKGIIEAHKGKIWIEEKEGNGTRVAFTLPKEMI